jgi:hypothetical protein
VEKEIKRPIERGERLSQYLSRLFPLLFFALRRAEIV